jgi:murein DD-endopeptidase MepM/ murein hydrolase activator NlpD
MIRQAFLFFLSIPFFFACKPGKGLFGAKRLHEQYGQKLKTAGLYETALGRQWFLAADKALAAPQTISLPYEERGYFAAEKPRAAGLQFTAKRGQKLFFALEKNPAPDFTLFIELWRVREGRDTSFVLSPDSTQERFEQEIEGDEVYILRLQPELLKSGDYRLSISLGPSLGFPVPGGRIGSIWGDDRDAGARRHEGIDIFAPKRTPTTAAADGIITSVRDGGIGGKAIFMRPTAKAYSLYYAHLDEQLVSQGDRVAKGDTIGLVGNTGNAHTTPPHLHFGIYAAGGAINPLPFVDPALKSPAKVTVPSDKLLAARRSNTLIKTGNRAYAAHTVVYPLAVTARMLRVEMPDGVITEVPAASLDETFGSIRTGKLKEDSFLVESPEPVSARKVLLKAGTPVKVLGIFADYVMVAAQEEKGWLPATVL